MLIKTVNAVRRVEVVEVDRSYSSLTGETDREGDMQLESYVLDHDTQILGEQSNTQQSSSIEIEGRALPRTLVIPFARHSSWPELVQFVKALCPLEVHACTGDEGWRFSTYCKHGGKFEDKIKVYEDLTHQGLWETGSLSRRQKLHEDIQL